MAANYLHGIEVIELNIGPRPVRIVKTSVVALIGLAPAGPKQALTLVNTAADAAQFGPELPGFNIPEALRIIQSHGAGPVIVVNTHSDDNDVEEEEALSPNANGRFKTTYAPLKDADGISTLQIENQNGDHLVEGTDYTVDDFGNVRLLPPAINGTSGVRPISTFTINGGTVGSGNEITDIEVVGNSILAAAVPFTTDFAATAALVAAGINTNGFTATASGATVSILGPADTQVNGVTPALTLGGDVTTTTPTDFAGAVDPIPATTSTACKYMRLDASTITNNQLIGGMDINGVRTGMKLFEQSYSAFGFNPKVFIAPHYSNIIAIAVELRSKAEQFAGVAIIDGELGWTPAQAIADRGPSGTIFNTSTERALLVYPYLKSRDPYTDGEKLIPFSVFMAAGIAAQDLNNGYWYSASNTQILDVTGYEREIEGDPTRDNTEANLLNEAGIITYLNFNGLKFWGNRNSSWPSSTSPANFYSIRRTFDVVNESLKIAAVQFSDLPINNALIDAIRDTGKAFISLLVQRGALIDGDVVYDPADNPPTQIAAGQLAFRVSCMPPPPFERGTLYAYLDINYLRSLGQ